jgi:hypothetical protein
MAASLYGMQPSNRLIAILAEHPRAVICPNTVYFAANDHSRTGCWFLQQSVSFLSLGQATREEELWVQFSF